MTAFIDRLAGAIEVKNCPCVAGLDPKLDYIPDDIRNKAFEEYGHTLKGAAMAVLEFNRALIRAVCDIVPAVKPQLAYYEQFGAEGMRVFAETAAYARENGLLVIADAKRSDIGSTVEAYSGAFLGKTGVTDDIVLDVFNADALTVNPYLGIDGVKPFLDDCIKYDKGIFILVKTSNKSSVEIQDLKSDDGKRIYEVVAELVSKWGAALEGDCGYSSVCAVVGATWPEQAVELRKLMPRILFLVPGYGAQGGTAADCAACFDGKGGGAIVNASRSFMCAYKSDRWKDEYGPGRFADAARAEMMRMRDEINGSVGRRRN